MNIPTRGLTPPLSQMIISFCAASSVLTVGKNQKKRLLGSSGLLLMGNEPAYDPPTSKSTSGIPVPSTKKPSRMSRYFLSKAELNTY
jgi:hypothetical protein